MKTRNIELNVNDVGIVLRWCGDPERYEVEVSLPNEAVNTKLYRSGFALHKALTDPKYKARTGKLLATVLGEAEDTGEQSEA